ncbi:protein FAR1-RELATED SEQUENCE 5-like [Carya illinoinensis]|uniref:protein FAR1-RELATED SEQUENCE 5-like n=1 Tax=Carya illinoinensis TaxID=32201 RepID=UPI001C717E87|nr:protein FAR1-RELATED SEQUENCE 5-like [Carya illinoinensis]
MDFGWSSDSDEVEIVTSRNCPEDFVNETIEDDVNLGDGDGDGINLISTTGSGNLEPFVGKEFDEVEDAQAFYKAYARRKGFAMRTNHTQLSREDRKLVGVHYVCTREGFRRESFKQKERKNPELAETKIGCKATMCIKKDGERWIVCKFVPEHNHVLLTPRSTSLLRGHRGVTRVQKKLILTLNESGIPTRKIMSVLSKESGGDFNTGCIGKDVDNYLGNKRRKLFEEGDAQRLYAYFLDRQCKEPGFVYSMQIDENGCMGSCFWADARSRSAYQYFGDVVTFDATYLTNIYKMPFVPFSGVNHHHQTIMFGCALLVNETAESYIWLLRTWQEAMLGRAPLTIITDDDKAMAKAIAEVLPNTTHRLCLWHILQKFPEHLAHVYNQFPDFSKEFRHCIHETITCDEFEEEWSSIILKYGLVGNDWLENLYNRRYKWVPAYLRTTFCAGMSTTQRSESMNKFFKDYVRSSTMVSDFVHQYEKALDAHYFKEKEKDVRTKSTKAVLKTCWSIEEEAASVYTRKSFQIFQAELFNSQRYKASKVQKEGESKMYAVAPNGKEKPIYYVTLESGEMKAICTCHMFEFLGIVCRHILCVLTKKSKLDVLPYHYVVERWTINAKSRAILELPVSEGHVMTQEDPIMRKNKLMMQFYDVADLGSQSSFKMNHLSHALEKVHNELLLMEDIGERNFEVGDMSRNDSLMLRSQVISNFSQTIQYPQRVPTKGRPKSLRAKNPKETQTVKKRR